MLDGANKKNCGTYPTLLKTESSFEPATTTRRAISEAIHYLENSNNGNPNAIF
jgi:hypothetical protein